MRYDKTIFQYSIPRCIGNIIHNLVIFSRILPFRATNTRTKYKIVWLLVDFNPRNYKGNHKSSHINIDEWPIFQYSIQWCIRNTIYSLVIFSRVVTLCETNTLTLRPSTKLLTFLWILSMELKRQSHVIVYGYRYGSKLSSNIILHGVLGTQSIIWWYYQMLC